MTSAENGGTTTRNVFSGGDKQKIENLQNKVSELVNRLEVAENKIEGQRLEIIKLNKDLEMHEEAAEVEVETQTEPEIKKDFSGVKGAEEDESEEPIEKVAKPKKSKK